MKIYTKTGDKGKTSLFGGERVPKYHPRIEAYGTVDELNSHIGLIRSHNIHEEYSKVLLSIQNNLFTIGSFLATPANKRKIRDGDSRLHINIVGSDAVAYLEDEMDKMNMKLPEMRHFILPGGHPTVSFCHVARCVCRRAERMVAYLSDEEALEPEILIYLNRLSDYLFVLARKLTYENDAKEIQWISGNLK
jgi:cob(I)alamin adenosyltransferase